MRAVKVAALHVGKTVRVVILVLFFFIHLIGLSTYKMLSIMENIKIKERTVLSVNEEPYTIKPRNFKLGETKII